MQWETNNFWNTGCVKETMIVGIMDTSPSIIRISSAWAKPNKGEKQGIMRNATKFEAATQYPNRLSVEWTAAPHDDSITPENARRCDHARIKS